MAGSEDFWRLAIQWLPRLHQAKVNEGIITPIPQLVSLRRKMYKSNIPEIKLRTAFQHKETGETTIVEGESIPTAKFNPRKYTKLYESASVEVSS